MPRSCGRAAVLAFPSLYEGFGFPPLQAMQARVPVVATRAGSLPEVLGDGARLVDIGDRDGLAAALEACLTDESVRRGLVAAGTNWVARFTWASCGEGPRNGCTAMPRRIGVPDSPPTVLAAVDQLRRQVPGGIGAYARGLLAGLDRCTAEGDGVALTLLASRPPRHRDDPLTAFGLPLVTSQLPGRLMTRTWDHSWLRAPEGFDVVHSVSLAAPMLRPGSPSRLSVTVHDVAWHRHPEATTARGRRWHEAALCRARDANASLVVPSRLVAADLVARSVSTRRGSPSSPAAPITWRHPMRTPPPSSCAGSASRANTS